MAGFIEAIRESGITIEYDTVLKIILRGGDKTAREHYNRILFENPELEEEVLLKLAESNADLRYWIEERAAISECSIVKAVKQLMRHN